MKTTISKSDFRDAFHRCGRGEQFSYEALGLLFDYFEEVEDSCGMETELDPISVCCEFSEDTPEEIAEYYDIDLSDVDDDNIADAVEEYLINADVHIGNTKNGTIVYRQF